MCANYRLGAEGPYRIGLNEVRINIIVPQFAIEVARGRLYPSWFNRTAIKVEIFDPHQSVKAGFLDRVLPPADLQAAARAKAEEFLEIDMQHHQAIKRKLRAAWVGAVQQAAADELRDDSVSAALAAR